MAEVFRATLPGFGGFEKEVAIKRMYRQYSDDATFVEMLTDEAKIVSQLHHPNIVQILDVGRVEEDYYIAFEFVDGVDLFRLLQKQFERTRDLPLAMALHIIAELCSALDYAHARRTHAGDPLRIVHRDVSPQNVLIGYQGEVKLTDFGIAKAAYRFTQTQTGMIKGKLYYMSPEQAQNKAIDHRSDLFAAGILLYELLCTRPLYGDGKPKELLAKVGRGEYSWPAEKKARVPMPLLAVVDKALQRNADQRYQTGREFREALLRVADQLGLRTDREALGAYVRKVYDVTENRPPAVSAAPRTETLARDDKRAHWSTSVGPQPTAPGELDQPTTRRPSHQPSQEGLALPRARRAATLPTPAPIGPDDGVPPPLPTTMAQAPDDATAMLDMADLAARLAVAPPPQPLHGAAAAPHRPASATGVSAPTGASALTGPSAPAGPPAPLGRPIPAGQRSDGRPRQPTEKGVAPPPQPLKARNPHLLRTGGHQPPQAIAPPPAPRRLSSSLLRAGPQTVAPAAKTDGPPPAAAPDAPSATRASGQRRKAYPRPSTAPAEGVHRSEAATRFVQAMADEAAANPVVPAAAPAHDPATRAPRKLGSGAVGADTAPRPASRAVRAAVAQPPTARPVTAQGGRADAATRFVQAMDAYPERGALVADPDDEPASWRLICLTAAVWAGVIVLGVYSTLLLVR